jgi:hypothetical protein
VIENSKWENWRDPGTRVARLGDMDLDGVKMEVLYRAWPAISQQR